MTVSNQIPLPKRIVIVGAGPAGLTAAADLAESGHDVTVLDKDPEYVGGIARTVELQRLPLRHRRPPLLQQDEEVTDLWTKSLPDDMHRPPAAPRASLYRGKFFDYPLKAANALFGLGLCKSVSLHDFSYC